MDGLWVSHQQILLSYMDPCGKQAKVCDKLKLLNYD